MQHEGERPGRMPQRLQGINQVDPPTGDQSGSAETTGVRPRRRAQRRRRRSQDACGTARTPSHVKIARLDFKWPNKITTQMLQECQ